MEWWQLLLLAGVAVVLVLAVAAFLLWRAASGRVRTVANRLGRLPWRLRLKLAWHLMRDGRVPLLVRAVPPLLVAYLALPLDILPDFIPVLGQLDDLVVILVAVSLVARFIPLDVIDAHLSQLEAEASRLSSEEG